jgi:hypothetical protein
VVAVLAEARMRAAWWLLRFLAWRVWAEWFVAPVEDVATAQRQGAAWLHRLQEPAPISGVRCLTVDELLAECGFTREVTQ